MSAAAALRAAVFGVIVRTDGGDLLLEAPAPPPPDVLADLRRYKAAILALLRPARDGWSAADWRAFFDERAGIAEFDAGLPRAEAEASAFASCIAEWLDRNSVQGPPGCCLGCGDSDRSGDPLIPFGTEASGLAWLHGQCWPAWYEKRRAEAVSALQALLREAMDSGK